MCENIALNFMSVNSARHVGNVVGLRRHDSDDDDDDDDNNNNNNNNECYHNKIQ